MVELYCKVGLIHSHPTFGSHELGADSTNDMMYLHLVPNQLLQNDADGCILLSCRSRIARSVPIEKLLSLNHRQKSPTTKNVLIAKTSRLGLGLRILADRLMTWNRISAYQKGKVQHMLNITGMSFHASKIPLNQLCPSGSVVMPYGLPIYHLEPGSFVEREDRHCTAQS